MQFDVVTLGETMLRLTPPGFDRLEQANQFEVHVGGSESNTAVGLARMGLQVAWLSRLADNPMGRSVAGALRNQGVDVSRVIWSDSDRLGTYYLERGKPPRPAQVYYDRANSAASRIVPDDLPSDLFQPQVAKLFHTTGITLGISTTAAATARAAAERAKAAGWIVSFDVNYRAKLWSAEAAAAGCAAMFPFCDILFLPIRDARQLFGATSSAADEVLQTIARTVPQRLVVMTLGAHGAIAQSAAGKVFHQPAYPTTEVERLGSGDAFSAGFLYRYLTTQDVADALRWGAAMASLKYTIPGDLPLIDRQEVEALVSAASGGSITR